MPKFAKFMQTLLKGTKEKTDNEKVNMTEKDDMAMPKIFPPNLKDPSKFTICCTIGGVKIPYALCDLGSSINVMPVKKVKELKVGEITLSNMTLTLVDSYVTQPLGILRDILVHVDGLLFPIDFVVLDTKGDSGESVIPVRPFLETGNAKIDMEVGELILKFNKEKVVFKVYD
ncbi:uncharacterized protein LOC127137704 [Lathyrus oleraceus]|uniref:uncharacterized protein LOC127137704 n=1 Tax=Pisum sativum TaxID=3888 RepID=UPI0021CF93AB|nr:uncharacterized protein LOC127137704 [Pisum sativum]